jgi:predicted nucleic acid-binding protein
MIVLDASALVGLVLDQPVAEWVLDQLEGQEVLAPAHQPAEVLSAVARLVRGDVLDDQTAREVLEEAASLPQVLVPVTPQHLQRAYALRERIRVVDGLYVALAEERACPLLTTDLRLAASSPPCAVRSPPV